MAEREGSTGKSAATYDINSHRTDKLRGAWCFFHSRLPTAFDVGRHKNRQGNHRVALPCKISPRGRIDEEPYAATSSRAFSAAELMLVESALSLSFAAFSSPRLVWSNVAASVSPSSSAYAQALPYPAIS